MNEQTVDLVARFFFFVLIDESVALKASHHACGKISKLLKHNASSRDQLVVAIRVCSDLLKPFMKNLDAKSAHPNFQSGWETPVPISMGPWLSFTREVRCEELEVFIWVEILKVDESIVAEALNLKNGSLRFRLTHAHRQLGSHLERSPS